MGSGMFRFPNPSSDIRVFTHTFRVVAGEVGTRPFKGDDISRVLAQERLASSQGAVGYEALARSTRADRSRDPMYNQVKMYAELWRRLGWISSIGDTALEYQVTAQGRFILEAANPGPLVIESLLGITSPSDAISGNYTGNLRPVATILRTMKDLDGELSRDEMIVGPLTMDDDQNTKTYAGMRNAIRTARKGGLVGDIFEERMAELGISRTSMENYTRFPMAAIPSAGWATRKSGVLHLTKQGADALASISKLPDVRLKDYRGAKDPQKEALARLGFVQMLRRSGIEPALNPEVEKRDLQALAGSPWEGGFMFSPFQQLSLAEANRAISKLSIAEAPAVSRARPIELVRAEGKVRQAPVAVVEYSVEAEKNTRGEGQKDLRSELEQLLAKKGWPACIDVLVANHAADNQDVFYPLVASLFNMAGFECKLPRRGDNYSRYDAVLLGKDWSIPIEIKSPGEETEISVKAVRQALENKIVFMARRAFPCKPEHSSLAIGYNLPHDRSEVHELIADVHATFGMNVAVLDLRGLAELAFSALRSDGAVAVSGLLTARGVVKLAAKYR